MHTIAIFIRIMKKVYMYKVKKNVQTCLSYLINASNLRRVKLNKHTYLFK